MKFNISKLVVKQNTYLMASPPPPRKWYGNKGQHEQTVTNSESLCWIVFTYDLDV